MSSIASYDDGYTETNPNKFVCWNSSLVYTMLDIYSQQKKGKQILHNVDREACHE